MEMCKYKPYLEKLNYPNINIFSDEQVAAIFSSENRYFLLKWLAKHLNSEFITPIDLSESSAISFSNFFYESGFCTSIQKLLFVNGDKKLPIKEQIKIFDRIFLLLDKNFEKENVEPNQAVSNTEDLQLFLHKDVNLFSTLGVLKPYSLKEMEQKFRTYTEEIEEINQIIKNHNENSNETVKSLDAFDHRQIEKNTENFKEEVTKLKDIIADIQRNKQSNESETRPCFKDNFGNCLIDCNSKIESILQYFQSLNLIKHLNEKQTQEKDDYEENEIYRILKQNTDNSIDILELSKEFQ